MTDKILIIEFQVKNGRDKLEIQLNNDRDTFTGIHSVYVPKHNKWTHIKSHYFKSKTDIMKYLFEQDPSINLDYLFDFNWNKNA